MYGDLANKLVLDAKRSQNLTELPVHQSELVRDIVKEINDLNRDAEFINETQRDDELSEAQQKIHQCQLFVTHLCMRRNKRCLLAYQKTRADKINQFCWLNIDPDSTPPSQAQTTSISIDNLSHAEQDYYKSYNDLLIDYKSNFADLDLSGDLEPPTNIFIDVRVLKDGGEVQTEYGVFNLIKDSQFYVRKSDVERLIQQGYLEEL